MWTDLLLIHPAIRGEIWSRSFVAARCSPDDGVLRLTKLLNYMFWTDSPADDVPKNKKHSNILS